MMISFKCPRTSPRHFSIGLAAEDRQLDVGSAYHQIESTIVGSGIMEEGNTVEGFATF